VSTPEKLIVTGQEGYRGREQLKTEAAKEFLREVGEEIQRIAETHGDKIKVVGFLRDIGRRKITPLVFSVSVNKGEKQQSFRIIRVERPLGLLMKRGVESEASLFYHREVLEEMEIKKINSLFQVRDEERNRNYPFRPIRTGGIFQGQLLLLCDKDGRVTFLPPQDLFKIAQKEVGIFCCEGIPEEPKEIKDLSTFILELGKGMEVKVPRIFKGHKRN